MKVIVTEQNNTIDTFEINDFSNLITYINIDSVPEKLGKSLRERVIKYLDLRKKGYLIIKTK